MKCVWDFPELNLNAGLVYPSKDERMEDYLPFDSGLIALRPVPLGGLVAQEGGIVSSEKMISPEQIF